MNKLLATTLFSLALSLSYSQNLIIDGGLEDTLKCPQSGGRFYHPTNTNERYTAQWRATTLASPDYNNSCGYNTFQSRTGDGYAGILYYDPSEYREYISALMSQAMVAGECYYVEYYVALNANSTLAIDEIQVHFSNGVPLDMTFPPPGPLVLTPHLQAASAPTSSSYQKVSGFYTAAGGEDVMTMGNFHDNANTTLTTVSAVGSVNAYYFIDDVTVTQLDLGPDVDLCEGDSSLVVPNILCPTLTYAWSNGSADTVAYAVNDGFLALDISGNGSCSVIDTVLVNVQTIDTSVTENFGILSANQAGATYQWLDCMNGNAPIVGEINQTINSSFGQYAVEITLNGCTDTSACYFLQTEGIEELQNNTKQFIKVVDLMGRETKPVPNTPLLYMYSDGTVERVFYVD